MRILIATDGSNFSREAAAFAGRLPFPGDVEAVLLSVIEDLNLPMVQDSSSGALADLHRVLIEQANERLQQEASTLWSEGWSVVTDVQEGDPASQIVDEAARLQADLIVLGSRGLNSFAGYLLGRVSHRVLRHAPCSVLLVRPVPRDTPPAGRPFKVLLAYDGSDPCHTAVDLLASLPFGPESQILLTSVHSVVRTFRLDILQDLGPLCRAEKERALAQLKDAAASFKNFGQVQQLQVEGEDIAETILDVSKKFDANLIVVGHKGRSGLDRFLLGSISSKVAHHAPVSVLVVKEKRPAAASVETD